ncbi:MAG TPA: DNA polymerase I [Bacilli bacterium]|nr:DNA polymerase I [Bacilli bacterium]
MNRLTIVDGNSLLFRAYYASAYPGTTLMRTKDGIPTNAIYIFSNMMTRIISDINEGDGLLVAFDTGAKTFRHDQLESYKAQRKKAPEELIAQMPIAREMLKALGIFTFEMDGFEADDVAGSAAKLAHSHGHEVHIYTSDRDFLQLVNTTIKVNLIKKGMSDIRVMNRQRVIEEYGFTPEQVADYKGLCGDASDNLKGIPGIGDKTAIKLLNEFQTFENIVANADSIGGKIGANLLEFTEIGALSKKLALIQTDVPLPFSLADTVYEGFALSEATTFGTRYELRTFISKLPTSWRKDEGTLTIETTIVSSLDKFKVTDKIGLHFDVKAGNYHRLVPSGLAISSVYNTVYMTLEDAKKDQHLHNLLANTNIKKFVYDLKAVYVFCDRFGLPIKGPFFDVLLASYTLDTSSGTNPETSLAMYGAHFSSDESVQLFDEADPQKCGQIAYYLWKLFPKISMELKEKDAESILYDVEIPLALVLAKMEREGVPIDVAMLQKLGAEYRRKLLDETNAIYEAAGHEFNINSPKQVAQVLFEELGLPKNRKGSTSADVLKALASEYPIAAHLLEQRKYGKLLSTYIEALVGQVHEDGKLHAIFNQALTATGRLSSTEPNLQNIAVRDEEGRMVRQAFYYDDKYRLVSLDYSQIELRILAHLSKCAPLIEVFNRDEDIHTATANMLFAHGGEVTSLMRRQAKAVNFGIIYGISDWGLAEQLEIPPSEARLIINRFYETFKEVRSYMLNLIETVQTNGYVTTLTGRRRYLREIHDSNYQTREFAKRAAMNAPIQGTAADLIKIAMIKIDQELTNSKLGAKLILQIHDELIFKVPVAEVEDFIPMAKQMMENAIPLDVKLEVGVTSGKSWYDLK